MLPGIGLLTLGLTIANFFWWRGRYSKKGVVQKYGTLLARTLELRSGSGPYYRSTDVTRAILASHLSTTFSAYAYAMFCDPAEFAKAPDCAQRNYDALRREIADLGARLANVRPTPGKLF